MKCTLDGCGYVLALGGKWLVLDVWGHFFREHGMKLSWGEAAFIAREIELGGSLAVERVDVGVLSILRTDAVTK